MFVYIQGNKGIKNIKYLKSSSQTDVTPVQ